MTFPKESVYLESRQPAKASVVVHLKPGATLLDAKSHQLRPVIVREAVQDRSEVAHEWTLFDVQARFADVVGLEEALAYLRGLKR